MAARRRSRGEGGLCSALLVLTWLGRCFCTPQAYIPFGLQSGGKKDSALSTYATSLAYDQKSRELIVVGGTYGTYFAPGEKSSNASIGMTSDCFVGILHLPHLVTEERNFNSDRLSWVRRRQFGSSSVSEFCSGIQVGEDGNMSVFGHSGDAGLLSELIPDEDVHRQRFGMLLEMNDAIDLEGGLVLHDNAEEYPLAMASDDSFQNAYIASIFSEASSYNPDMDNLTKSRVYRGGEDLATTGYRPPMYGRDFTLRLQRLERASSISSTTSTSKIIGEMTGKALEPRWSREYLATGLRDVQVSSLVYIDPTTLLMAGYTTGSGRAFGFPSNRSSTSFGGFVTKIHPESGNVLEATRIEANVDTSNERVLALCNPNNATSNFVYVVGMTDGLFDNTYVTEVENNGWHRGNSAFLLKMDTETMKIIWSRQLGARFVDGSMGTAGIGDSPQVHGTACVVTPDDEFVYMAGAVKDGAALSLRKDQSFRSAGADDIFVAQFGTHDGSLHFAKQMGTPEDDYLALGNSLATDEEGNLIVLGNTRGSLYRSKTNNGISDIFTFSIGREDGNSITPVGTALTEEENKPINEVTIGPTGDIISSDGPPPMTNSASRQDKQHSKALSVVWVLLSFVVIFIAFQVLVFGRQRAKKILIFADNDLQDSASGQNALDSLEEAQARYNEKYGCHQLDFMEDKKKFLNKPDGKNWVGFYDSGESVASTMDATLISLDVDAKDQSDGSGPPIQKTPVHLSICRQDGLVENDNANPRLLSSRAVRLQDEVCDFLSIDSDFQPLNASQS